MEQIFDVYGIMASTLESAKIAIEGKLNIRLHLHESEYLGEYYRCGKPYAEGLILQKNYDKKENEWAEEEHKDATLILYVNQPSDPEGLKEQLATIPGFVFLRRKKLPIN